MAHFDSYSNITYSGLTLQVRKSDGSFHRQQTTFQTGLLKIPSVSDLRCIQPFSSTEMPPPPIPLQYITEIRIKVRGVLIMFLN